MMLSRRQSGGVLGAGAAQAALRSASAREAAAGHYGLVVVGVGSGGFGAALAGARRGLSVLCVERAHGIGGNAVQSGVTMWEPGVGGTGFPFEIYTRLKEIPQAVGIYAFGRHCSWDGWKAFPGGESVVDPSCHYLDTLRRHRSREVHADEAFRRTYWHGVVFEPEAYARTLREMLLETGRVTLLTKTTFEDVEARDGRVTALRLVDGSRVTADAFVDGTGGGALCKACGSAVMLGQEGKDTFGEPSAADKPNDLLNGVTLIFRVGPGGEARVEPLPDGVPTACWWGQFPAMSAVKYPNGDYNCNMLPTMEGREFAARSYRDARAECERRVRAYWHHVQTNWPEFQRYRINWIAPALGVRETTRVVGEYVLTEHDLRAGLSGQEHADIITIADHAIDRHGAGGGGGEVGEPYGVPYRCLVPKGFSNLLIACRGASFSSLAASSCRLSRTMMQLGQAAGTAAALAADLGVALPGVPAEPLRKALREQNIELDWPRPAELEQYLRET